MIDLSLMKGVHVDAKARTARAQGGLNWNEFNRETQVHGLATTGGVVSTTGIAGLTLGGGLGWLMGKYGLAVDNLLSADLVMADGRVLRAAADENADLFWAIRGGGGNFGIAASFEYRLHAVGPTITGGGGGAPVQRRPRCPPVLPRPHRLASRRADGFRGPAPCPRRIGHEAGRHRRLPLRPPAAGEAAVRPIKQFGSPAMDAIGPMPYNQMNSMLDEAYPRGALNYWKSNFLATLSDQAIDTMIKSFASCPSPMSQMLLEHFHGAAARIRVEDTAIPHRTEGYNLLVLGQWMTPTETERCTAWARDAFGAMTPFMASGRYVNYLGEDEAGDPVAAAYGPNYKRLQQIKAQYDPANFFHMNQNITPQRRAY